MKKIMSLLSLFYSGLLFIACLVFFLDHVIYDPQWVLGSIINEVFYARLLLLILSALSLFFNVLSLIVKKERLFKTAAERKQDRKARRNEKILQLNAKIEKLKNKDDE